MNELLKNQRFLLVFDLDGTLLSSEKTILPKTKSLLQELVSYGNVVSIASGRPSRSIYEYSNQLGLKGPFIAYNGAEIENPYDSDFKPFRKPISKDVILDFLSHFGEDSFKNIMIEDDKVQLYLHENEEYVNFFHPDGMIVRIGSILKNLEKDMMTCVIQVKDPDRREEMVRYVNDHYENMSIRFWRDSDCFGEFYFYDTNKATSVMKLAGMYSIDRAHVISFGDALNDLQMITAAGISFAMKNGDSELKKAATFITPYDNDHEGIYYALLDLFKIKP